MGIKRYLVLVTALVAMGLGTVWWKTQTLAMGYDAVRIDRELSRAVEEERLEDSRLVKLTALVQVRRKVKDLKLSLEVLEEATVARGRRRGAAGGRAVAAVEGRRNAGP